MKKFILSILLLNICSWIFAQGSMENDCANRIALAGEKEVYKSYQGKIQVAGDTIRFNKNLVVLSGTKPELYLIFGQGLVFPELALTNGANTNAPLNELLREETVFISNVKEVEITGQKSNIKTFTFLKWQKGIANPSLYLFQLSSEEAVKTDMKSFLQKARLKSFGFCSILI